MLWTPEHGPCTSAEPCIAWLPGLGFRPAQIVEVGGGNAILIKGPDEPFAGKWDGALSYQWTQLSPDFAAPTPVMSALATAGSWNGGTVGGWLPTPGIPGTTTPDPDLPVPSPIPLASSGGLLMAGLLMLAVWKLWPRFDRDYETACHGGTA